MNNLLHLLEVHGPMTGKEIHEETTLSIFDLWLKCNHSADIVLQTVGTKYLRLDRYVEGFARLSPSIIREFCSYSVVGLKSRSEEAKTKADRLLQSIIRISRNKFELARTIMEEVIESQDNPQAVQEKACFLIAGDVVYEMAHHEPRPESSTGKIVNGSDLDILVIYNDLAEEIIESLDSAIYRKKFYLLNNPSYKEEIDYVIKDLPKVDRQLEFEGFESMVASKNLEESKFLCGNHALFLDIKKMVSKRGIPDRITVLKERAYRERENARRQLLTSEDAVNDKQMRQLLFTTDEREEFYNPY